MKCLDSEKMHLRSDYRYDTNHAIVMIKFDQCTGPTCKNYKEINEYFKTTETEV